MENKKKKLHIIQFFCIAFLDELGHSEHFILKRWNLGLYPPPDVKFHFFFFPFFFEPFTKTMPTCMEHGTICSCSCVEPIFCEKSMCGFLTNSTQIAENHTKECKYNNNESDFKLYLDQVLKLDSLTKKRITRHYVKLLNSNNDNFADQHGQNVEKLYRSYTKRKSYSEVDYHSPSLSLSDIPFDIPFDVDVGNQHSTEDMSLQTPESTPYKSESEYVEIAIVNGSKSKNILCVCNDPWCSVETTGQSTLHTEGQENETTGQFTVTTEGQENETTGQYTVPTEGQGNDNIGHYPVPIEAQGYETTGQYLVSIKGQGNETKGQYQLSIEGQGIEITGQYPAPIEVQGNETTGKYPVQMEGQGNDPFHIECQGNETTGQYPNTLEVQGNETTGQYPAPIEGQGNETTGKYPVLIEVQGNDTTGHYPVHIEGQGNETAGQYPIPIEGQGNETTGQYPVPVAGQGNETTGQSEKEPKIDKSIKEQIIEQNRTLTIEEISLILEEDMTEEKKNRKTERKIRVEEVVRHHKFIEKRENGDEEYNVKKKDEERKDDEYVGEIIKKYNEVLDEIKEYKNLVIEKDKEIVILKAQCPNEFDEFGTSFNVLTYDEVKDTKVVIKKDNVEGETKKDQSEKHAIETETLRCQYENCKYRKFGKNAQEMMTKHISTKHIEGQVNEITGQYPVPVEGQGNETTGQAEKEQSDDVMKSDKSIKEISSRKKRRMNDYIIFNQKRKKMNEYMYL